MPRSVELCVHPTSIERDTHLLIRAHIVLTGVGDSDEKGVVGEALVALARGRLEVATS